MCRVPMRLLLALTVVTSSTAFALSRMPLVAARTRGGGGGVALSTQQPTVMKATMAGASTAVLPLSASSVLKQFACASVKKKLIFLAHPIAAVALVFVLKSAVDTMLLALFKPKAKRFYGISKPVVAKQQKKNGRGFFTSLPLPWSIGGGTSVVAHSSAAAAAAPAVVPSKPAAAIPTPKKLAAVAATSAVSQPNLQPASSASSSLSSSSILQARAQVLKILAAVDEATLKAKRSSNQFVGSFTTLLGRDQGQVALDAYKARNKQAEKQRRAKFEKAKAAEMRMQKEAEATRLAAERHAKEEEKRRLREANVLAAKSHAHAPTPQAAAQVLAPVPTKAVPQVATVTGAVPETAIKSCVMARTWSPHMAVAGGAVARR